MSDEPKSPTIHLVDDNEVDRIAIRRILASVGIAVKEYADSDAFLAELGSSQIACLVVDVRMPGLDGPSLQRELLERCLDIPIILVSGVATVPIATAAMRLGALDLLEKPVDPERFVSLVKTALSIGEDREMRMKLALQLKEELATLTEQERLVLPSVCDGLSIKAIAAQRELTFTEAARCQSSVLEKFSCCNPLQLLKRFQKAGLLAELDPSLASVDSPLEFTFRSDRSERVLHPKSQVKSLLTPVR
ncbi:response regulator transcription factor [Rhodopirellula sp. P2]|uniref:response regulator transcription factor n=1 Tax=Rhodopirellula sp. P2 TaxID=2127060 RepID=UPI0023677A2F|nr:response regulator [Rhodopirellula sp. P2]WDQ15464.1 response regulator [Rhodopirellula sp. P2]